MRSVGLECPCAPVIPVPTDDTTHEGVLARDFGPTSDRRPHWLQSMTTGSRSRTGSIVLGSHLIWNATLPILRRRRWWGAWVIAAMIIVLIPARPSAAALLPAIARPDAGSVASGTVRTVAAPGVLANDLQIGSGYVVDLVATVSHGTLTLDSDGGYAYRPVDGFDGTDVFRYRILGSLLGPSNTTTVTISVTAPAPTPTPTATPTPTPVPTQLPTMAPTMAPTPPPTATIPPPTLPALPSLDPPRLPDRATGPSPAQRLPRVRPTATSLSRPSCRNRARSTHRPAEGRSRGRARARQASPRHRRPPCDPNRCSRSRASKWGPLGFDPSEVSIGGFEWVVPALVLTVPGILIVVAVLMQAIIGIAWLPVTRRWLGGDRQGRPIVVATATIGARVA